MFNQFFSDSYSESDDYSDILFGGDDEYHEEDKSSDEDDDYISYMQTAMDNDIQTTNLFDPNSSYTDWDEYLEGEEGKREERK
jgi:hypothetical protein